ncbi:hypothetical protein ACFVXW_33130 [Streptomyces sp. NPDC058251]|uniref:hypothetical protein n=1 Tax=unclassified Streptomyces TaxID=2593676 RepID=UPI0036ED3228
MDVIGGLAAIRGPLPEPGGVTPGDLFEDACEQAQQARSEYAAGLEAPCDGLDEDLLLAIGTARGGKEAADREIRLLLACGREFRGNRACRLEQLAEIGGMTPSANQYRLYRLRRCCDGTADCPGVGQSPLPATR